MTEVRTPALTPALTLDACFGYGPAMDPGTALVQIITVGVVIGVLVFLLASFGTPGPLEIGALALVGVAAIVWIAVRTRPPSKRE